MMRDDPHPCRFYPRADREPEFDGGKFIVTIRPTQDQDLRRILSFLLAAYMLFALLFFMTTRADPAPLVFSTDMPALAAAGE